MQGHCLVPWTLSCALGTVLCPEHCLVPWTLSCALDTVLCPGHCLVPCIKIKQGNLLYYHPCLITTLGQEFRFIIKANIIPDLINLMNKSYAITSIPININKLDEYLQYTIFSMQQSVFEIYCSTSDALNICS
jgi:hypothetical protein